MPPPLLTASVRYTDQATSKTYWLPSIAATTLVPTRAEINAGTDLTSELNSYVSATAGGSSTAGWTFTVARINTQPINQAFQTEIAGSLSVADPSLTLYASKNGTDIRALLPAGTPGFVMFCDGGDTAGNKAQVFPVSVAAVSIIRADVSNKTATKITISFVITGAPAQSVTIPA
jgi:hypothetical protein